MVFFCVYFATHFCNLSLISWCPFRTLLYTIQLNPRNPDEEKIHAEWSETAGYHSVIQYQQILFHYKKIEILIKENSNTYSQII